MSISHIQAVRRKNKAAKVSGRKNDLCFYERQIIEVRIMVGKTTREIGSYLSRSASTICREVNRNCVDGGVYIAKKAQEEYERKQGKTNTKKLQKEENRDLRRFVFKGVKGKDWSPQQVAGRLDSAEAPEHLNGKTVSHETIYKFIYNTTVGTHLYKYLRRKSCAQRKSWQGRSSDTVRLEELRTRCQ